MTDIFSSKPLAELSLAELKKKEKSINIMSYVLGGLILLILLYFGVTWYQKGTPPRNMVYMGGFAAMAYLMGIRSKKVKAEIATRQ
ncbi:MAG: hypothetical protein H7319_19030 [Spirosoma sp.]|nr:hypothetical protein [Spirosoma sp.]